jgi:hypothetical protein
MKKLVKLKYFLLSKLLKIMKNCYENDGTKLLLLFFISHELQLQQKMKF